MPYRKRAKSPPERQLTFLGVKTWRRYRAKDHNEETPKVVKAAKPIKIQVKITVFSEVSAIEWADKNRNDVEQEKMTKFTMYLQRRHPQHSGQPVTRLVLRQTSYNTCQSNESTLSEASRRQCWNPHLLTSAKREPHWRDYYRRYVNKPKPENLIMKTRLRPRPRRTQTIEMK